MNPGCLRRHQAARPSNHRHSVNHVLSLADARARRINLFPSFAFGI